MLYLRIVADSGQIALTGAHTDFLFLLRNRSLYITFSDFESVQGLPAFRYTVPEEILANTSDNAGFCIPKGNCLGSGVLNVSVCKNGKDNIIMSVWNARLLFFNSVVSPIEQFRPFKNSVL